MYYTVPYIERIRSVQLAEDRGAVYAFSALLAKLITCESDATAPDDIEVLIAGFQSRLEAAIAYEAQNGELSLLKLDHPANKNTRALQRATLLYGGSR